MLLTLSKETIPTKNRQKEKVFQCPWWCLSSTQSWWRRYSSGASRVPAVPRCGSVVSAFMAGQASQAIEEKEAGAAAAALRHSDVQC